MGENRMKNEVHMRGYRRVLGYIAAWLGVLATSVIGALRAGQGAAYWLWVQCFALVSFVLLVIINVVETSCVLKNGRGQGDSETRRSAFPTTLSALGNRLRAPKWPGLGSGQEARVYIRTVRIVLGLMFACTVLCLFLAVGYSFTWE